MRTLRIVPALVAVVVMAFVVPAKPAEAFAVAPVLAMLFTRLVDRGLTKPHPVSDEALNLTAHVRFDGEEIAASFAVQETAAVIAKMSGHEVVYLLDPNLVMRPHLDRGIRRVEVWGNTIDTIRWDVQDARRCAASGEGYVSLAERDKDNPPERWLIPININRLSGGAHTINVDVYFGNGRKESSLRGFAYLYVTSYEALTYGVNSPDVQDFLRSLSGTWSPIPSLGTTSVPLANEMAEHLGMTQMAQAAGIPSSGTAETTTTTRKVGQVQHSTSPGTPPAQPVQSGVLDEVLRESGYAGDPSVACVYRTIRDFSFVPLVITLRSPDQRVVINGDEHIPYIKGHPFIMAQARAGMDLSIQIDGRDFFEGIVPRDGLGLWLVVQ